MLNKIPPTNNGFSLIEPMIAITIIGLLLVIAIPSYSEWIQNTQIRTATESIQNGLQLARAEAVRRNAAIQFNLGTGTGWTISVVSDSSVVQTRTAAEGSANVTVTVTPAGATGVTFNGLGRLNGVGLASTITRIDTDVPPAILPANLSRNLAIVINPFGRVVICDPDPSIAAGDSRSCL